MFLHYETVCTVHIGFCIMKLFVYMHICGTMALTQACKMKLE